MKPWEMTYEEPKWQKVDDVQAEVAALNASGNHEAASQLAEMDRQQRPWEMQYDQPHNWLDKPKALAKQIQDNGLTVPEQTRRMLINAGFSLPEMAVDLPYQSWKFLGNKINDSLGIPEQSNDYAPIHDLKDKAFKSMGVSQEPTGEPERIAQSGLNALTGYGIGKNLLGKFGGLLATAPAQQIGGAMVGTAASDAGKAAGLPEWEQAALGLTGGLLGGNIAGAVTGIGGGIANTGKALLTGDGRDDIASRIFYKNIADPEKVIPRLEAFQQASVGPWKPGYGPGVIVKDSVPITPEIASDVGVSSLSKAFRANSIAHDLQLDQLYNGRIANSDQAIGAMLDKVNRRTGEGEDMLNKLSGIGQKSYSKFMADKDLQSLPVDTTRINAVIDEMIKRYSRKPEIKNFLESTKQNIGENPSFQELWDARQTIDNDIYGANRRLDKPLSPAMKNSYDTAGKELRTLINEILKAADPDFEDYLRRAAFANEYADSIATGRALQDKMTNTGFNPAEGLDEVGSSTISAAKTAKNAKTLTDLAGNDTAIGQKLTDRQAKAFEAALRETNRRQALDLGTNQGSQTADLFTKGGLLGDQIFGAVFGDQNGAAKGMARRYLEKSLGVLGSPAEQDVMSRIAQAYISPEIALRMAKRGKELQRGPLDISGGISKSTRSGLLGVLESNLF